MPYPFGADAPVCKLPKGDLVKFYQMLPLYDNEMNYKVSNGAEALEKLFGDHFDMVLNANRKNLISDKKWFIKATDMKELLDGTSLRAASQPTAS